MYIDFATQEGATIKAAFEARLVELKERLCSVENTERETQTLRGQISEVKSWLKTVPHTTSVPRYSGDIIKRGNV